MDSGLAQVARPGHRNDGYNRTIRWPSIISIPRPAKWPTTSSALPARCAPPGIPVGPGAVIDALNALQVIEIGNRADVFTTLEAIFVKRHEHALIFAQAFDLFFRAAEEWKHMLDSVPLPDHAKKKPPPASRRVQEALAQPQTTEMPQAQEQELRLSVSDKEVLQKKDFAQMSAAEIAQVTRAIAQMKLPQAELRTRRYQPDARGLRLDMRRTLRGSLRTGGDIIDIHRLGRIDKPAPIVALLDISGSMSEYTRLFLHFLHAITDARKRVSVFLFGTRLTNVTRSLRARDPDEALAAVPRRWRTGPAAPGSAPRCMPSTNCGAAACSGRAPSCCLISDGLEREADAKLAFEMDRLHRSCRRLIWLNPLLRFGGFEAKAQGIKMMLPHVDEFRPVHNLSSIEGLIAALSSAPPPHHRSLIRPAA